MLACTNVERWCHELVFVAHRAKARVMFKRYYRWLPVASHDPAADAPDTVEWLKDHFARFYPAAARFAAE